MELPGKIMGINISFSLSWEREVRKKSPILYFKHNNARKVEGCPGQYWDGTVTFWKIGPLHGTISWRPHDWLSEAEYFRKYGTHEPVEETKWNRIIREEREKKMEKIISHLNGDNWGE